MENKRVLYGVFAGVLLAGLFGLYHINNLSGRIEHLEENVTGYQDMIGVKNVQITGMENQIKTLQSTLSSVSATNINLQDALESSQLNGTELKAEIRELESDISGFQAQIELQDDAVNLIGRDEIENLLWAYTEASMELDELQVKYDQLLQDYNALLTQQ